MNSEKIKAYNRKYYLEHLEGMRDKNRKYALEHPKEMRANSRKYYLRHQEKVKARRKRNQLEHPEETKAYRRKYYLRHPEKMRAWRLAHPENVKIMEKKYNQSLKGKERDKRRVAIRKQLGFVPLNSYFPGSESHHIDEQRIIYMPEEMHHLIRHSLLQNRNMRKINYLAFLYLESEEIYGNFAILPNI